MFKSIEYKLIAFICLLIVSVAASTYLILIKEFIFGALAGIVVLYSIKSLINNYRKFNSNLIFLLNALDNGDYSFNFSETKVSRREKELNQLLNRVKDIISKAREGVIENENFLSVIIESMPVGVIIIDDKKNIKSINKASLQLLNLNILTHLNQLSVIDKSFPQLFKNLSEEKRAQIKVTNEREEVEISLNLSKIKLRDRALEVIVLNNIGNELENREMESWIQLIRVMTHEIMNSIAPITSLTETLLNSYQSSEAQETPKELTIEALSTINDTAKGLTSFVNTYRQFTGVPKPKMLNFKLKPLIDSVIMLNSTKIKNNNIDIILDTKNENIELNADRNQIMQVLVNLVKNGIEAIGKTKKGVIRIEIVELDNRINIEISNNGEPIPKDIAPHIFIPFFSTKETGTGIGLSLSRYIMRLHGGNLKYYVKNDRTVFSMIF